MSSKFIIVTGGTHGIGRACVINLASQGHRVLFTGRDQVAGEKITSEFKNAIFRQCDLTIEQDCISTVGRALEFGEGKISGLVNNAGVSMRSAFHETELSDWDRIMNINARSVYHMTRLSMGGLIAAKGSVVTISSVAGLVGQKGLALYTASKAALIGLTQALALEYGEVVRFNAICPGQIGTRMMQAIIDDPVRLSTTLATIPKARLGSAKEVADVVAWLLSDASSFVNGAVVPVDGGETAGIFD